MLLNAELYPYTQSMYQNYTSATDRYFWILFLEDTLKVTHIILTETRIEYMFIRCSQNLSQLNLVSLIKSAHFKRRQQPT